MKTVVIGPMIRHCDYCGNVRETRDIHYYFPLIDCCETLYICPSCTEHVPSFVHIDLTDEILDKLVLLDQKRLMLYRFHAPTMLLDCRITDPKDPTNSIPILSETAITISMAFKSSSHLIRLSKLGCSSKHTFVTGDMFIASSMCYDDHSTGLLQHPVILFTVDKDLASMMQNLKGDPCSVKFSLEEKEKDALVTILKTRIEKSMEWI